MAEETVAANPDSGIVDDFDLDAFLLSDFSFFDFEADLPPEASDAESGISPTPDQSDGLDPSPAPADDPGSPDSVSSFASYIEKFLMEDVDWSGAEEGLGEDAAAADFFSGISLAGLAAPAVTVEDQSKDGKKVSAAVGVEDDDDDFASKKRRRQMRNRESAMMSRERKKMYIRDLELKSKHLSSERRRLEHALRCCVEENEELRRNLQMSATCTAAMAKQESAVLFVESLLLGSLFWFMSLACFLLAPGLPIPNLKAVSRSARDHVTVVSMTVSSNSIKLGRYLKLELLSSRRRWRGLRGMLRTFLSLVDVLPLFSNTVWGQKANIAFLKKHMGASFEKRVQPWVSNIREEDVHTGDFLAVSKIRGRWGGFETLEKWVTGAFAGHTAVCLKDESGKIWVGESGHENEKGEEVIVVIPWEEWWELALKDNSNPHIALLPLHPDLRAKFNATAAWAYARSMSGKPYGYHNMIFSWIDTVSDNYPPPLDANMVMSIMSMWTRFQPAYAANMWNEALNKRLGTEELDLYGIIAETEQRGMTFDRLLTIPEQDDWVYSDGKSTSCVAFILELYKEAGVFGQLSSSIQVTEFTIRDAYMLKIFENNQTRLPSWCNAEADGLLFCQILGEYRMELPQYNTIEPYAKMNENCPSLPPTYERTVSC